MSQTIEMHLDFETRHNKNLLFLINYLSNILMISVPHAIKGLVRATLSFAH